MERHHSEQRNTSPQERQSRKERLENWITEKQGRAFAVLIALLGTPAFGAFEAAAHAKEVADAAAHATYAGEDALTEMRKHARSIFTNTTQQQEIHTIQFAEPYLGILERGEERSIPLDTIFFTEDEEFYGLSHAYVEKARQRFSEIVDGGKQKIAAGAGIDDVMAYLWSYTGTEADVHAEMSILINEPNRGTLCKARLHFLAAATEQLYPDLAKEGDILERNYGAWVDDQGTHHDAHTQLVISLEHGADLLVVDGTIRHELPDVTIPTFEVHTYALAEIINATGYKTFADLGMNDPRGNDATNAHVDANELGDAVSHARHVATDGGERANPKPLSPTDPIPDTFFDIKPITIIPDSEESVSQKRLSTMEVPDQKMKEVYDKFSLSAEDDDALERAGFWYVSPGMPLLIPDYTPDTLQAVVTHEKERKELLRAWGTMPIDEKIFLPSDEPMPDELVQLWQRSTLDENQELAFQRMPSEAAFSQAVKLGTLHQGRYFPITIARTDTTAPPYLQGKIHRAHSEKVYDLRFVGVQNLGDVSDWPAVGITVYGISPTQPLDIAGFANSSARSLQVRTGFAVGTLNLAPYQNLGLSSAHDVHITANEGAIIEMGNDNKETTIQLGNDAIHTAPGATVELSIGSFDADPRSQISIESDAVSGTYSYIDIRAFSHVTIAANAFEGTTTETLRIAMPDLRNMSIDPAAFNNAHIHEVIVYPTKTDGTLPSPEVLARIKEFTDALVVPDGCQKTIELPKTAPNKKK